MSNGSISFRKFIRWLPDEASEPTSTLVLTSPQHRYVDLRILLSTEHGESPESLAVADSLPLERLDWAIAGVSSSDTRDDGRGGQIAYSTFYHWVDSRTMDPENATDQGDMFPLDDGTTLEKGAMVNPETGCETQYEELWHDVDPASLAAPPGMRCAVLKLQDGSGARGMAVRLGKYCQGFLRSADRLSIERWEWSEQAGWRRMVKMGQEALPCAAMLKDGASFRVDEAVETEDGTWTVVEVA